MVTLLPSQVYPAKHIMTRWWYIIAEILIVTGPQVPGDPLEEEYVFSISQHPTEDVAFLSCRTVKSGPCVHPQS